MAYTRPVRDDFDPVLWADNKTLTAELIREALVQKFIQGYNDFWGVQDGTSVHTPEEFQAIIDKMPAALDILSDAIKFKEFAKAAFPGLLDEKYHDGVFYTTVEEGKLIIGDLRPAWIKTDESVTPETESNESEVIHTHEDLATNP